MSRRLRPERLDKLGKTVRTLLDLFFRALVRVALGVFYRRVEVVGLERLPPAGPRIYVGNHGNSLIDPALALGWIAASLPLERDVRATYKVMISLCLFPVVWLTTCALVALATSWAGRASGVRRALYGLWTGGARLGSPTRRTLGESPTVRARTLVETPPEALPAHLSGVGPGEGLLRAASVRAPQRRLRRGCRREL